MCVIFFFSQIEIFMLHLSGFYVTIYPSHTLFHKITNKQQFPDWGSTGIQLLCSPYSTGLM